MKNSPRFLLWLIIFLTIGAIVINLPSKGFLSFTKSLSFKEGLDLAGGTSLTLKADMKDIPSDRRDVALDSAKNIIEKTRVNFAGVSEPIVQTSKSNKDYRIIVELPGVTDINEAMNRIGRTAKLEFREVKISTSSAITFGETLPTGLTGVDLKDSQPGFDSNTGKPIVLFRVADQSQEKFSKATQKLIGKQMAIFLDSQYISAPVVQSSIRDSGQISGNFTQKGTEELAGFLNGGALPVPLTFLQSKVVGPTLGLSSLLKSLFAGGAGIVIIIIFMICLYGRLGIIASMALVLYTLLVVSIFKVSSITPYAITLTLSGIAGFILSIGMAVDANILIFERMKEERRMNRSWHDSLELGFSRAWTSIRDSNISSLITSFVLYQYGTGPVRGFALTLAIGVLVSMFSAIVVTRTFLRIIYK